MGWDEHKRRRAALKLVLERAEQEPDGGLPYDGLKDVRKAFADRSDLILALQYQWSQALWSRIELVSLDIRRPSDASALARVAWAQCAAANPVLRRLLDAHLSECGRSVDAVREREQDVLVTAVA
jgi:hypothetical protein